jgi:MipA family protein
MDPTHLFLPAAKGKTQMKISNYLLALTTALLLAAPAAAQDNSNAMNMPTPMEDDDWSGFIAIGPGTVPEYEGADRYQLIPFVVADLRYRSFTLQVRGQEARINVLGNNGLIGGPVVAVRFPRSDVDGRVGRLNTIATGVDAGLFVGYRFGGDERGRGQVQVDVTGLRDVADVSNGFLATARISYAAVRSSKVRVDFDTSVSVADDKHMRTYFGITPAEAVRSGLAAYRPDGGVRDIGVGVNLGYQLGRRWGLFGRVGYNYYLDRAADSPVVKDEGSRNRLIAGAGISFRF